MYSDCLEVKEAGYNSSGIYDIFVNSRLRTVFCNMDHDGGGWTVSGLVIYSNTWTMKEGVGMRGFVICNCTWIMRGGGWNEWLCYVSFIPAQR